MRQDVVERGIGPGRMLDRQPSHPEEGHRVMIFLRVAGRRREAAQRCRHAVGGLFGRCVFRQTDPGDAKVRGVVKAVPGDLAPLQGPGQCDCDPLSVVVPRRCPGRLCVP